MRAEAGKASLSLTVEVEIPRHVHTSNHSRNSPSRQRRRERRAAAREAPAHHGAAEGAANDAEVDASLPKAAEVASANEASGKENYAVEATPNANDAVKASTVQAVLHEPSDVIENESIFNETNEKESEENNLASILSVIPLKHFNLDDDVIYRAIKNKIEAKQFRVKQIDIHRSIRGTFTRSDVLIEPAPVEAIKKIDFQFENCQVIPCFGFR